MPRSGLRIQRTLGTEPITRDGPFGIFLGHAFTVSDIVTETAREVAEDFLLEIGVSAGDVGCAAMGTLKEAHEAKT
jgi:hypothetical protein